jgi:iron-sulfur cluster repair protein YtfE (RIC family)
LLQAHARDLDHLFERYERGRSELAKRRIFEDIHHELEVHMRTQESVLYPAFEAGASESARARLAESRSEHQYLRSLLEDLSARREHDSRVQTEVADLRQDIARHMAVEESQLYAELQPRLAGEMVRDLGHRVHERLEELSSAGRSEARVGGGALSLGVDLLGIRL